MLFPLERKRRSHCDSVSRLVYRVSASAARCFVFGLVLAERCIVRSGKADTVGTVKLGVPITVDVCLLSSQEAGRFEHWGIWPKCKGHRHLKRDAALAGALAGEYRFIGGEGTQVPGPVSMVTKTRVSMWKPVQAHNEDGSAVIGLRTWGLAPQR